MKQIEEYLSNGPAEYAIAINGKWGKGKTYYIEEVLTPWIEETLKLSVFYFSLNGISSTEELHNLIITKSTVNYFSGSFKKLKKIGERVEKMASSIDKLKSAKTAFKFSDYHYSDKTIVILDDLERLSSKYSFQELLGYLNREFIESNNFRVILVGDYSQNRIKDSDLPKIKEKYVRWTIDFENDINKIYWELIKKFKTNGPYTKYLNNNSEFICGLFKTLDVENLRTIKFFLEVYEKIFSVVNKEDYQFTVPHVIYSTLILAVIYREGLFDSIANPTDLPYVVTQKVGIDKGLIYSANDSKLNAAETERVEKNTYLQRILERFNQYGINSTFSFSFLNSGFEYKFFLELYKFIVSGNLNNEEFEEELIDFSEEVKPVFKFQSNPNINNASAFRTLSEKEFKENIEEIFKMMDSGELALVHFGRAINLLVYFAEEKLLSKTKSQLKSFLRKSIKKIPKATDMSKPFGRPEFFEMDRIKKFDENCFEQLQRIITKDNERRRKNQSENILNNWESLKDDNNTYSNIINYSNPKDIFLKIKSLAKNREFIENLIESIRVSYQSINAGEYHSQDIPKLKSILSKLKSDKWEELDMIDNYFIRHLKKQIKDSIDHLNKTQS